MIASYTNQNQGMPMEDRSNQNFNSNSQTSVHGSPVPNSNFLNNYANDYLNTVKENRSMYGNFVDNSLAYDPYKEQKSVYNVVYETDAYNPWGILACLYSNLKSDRKIIYFYSLIQVNQVAARQNLTQILDNLKQKLLVL